MEDGRDQTKKRKRKSTQMETAETFGNQFGSTMKEGFTLLAQVMKPTEETSGNDMSMKTMEQVLSVTEKLEERLNKILTGEIDCGSNEIKERRLQLINRATEKACSKM